MDVNDGLISSDDSDNSLETQPHSPKVSDRSSSDSQATKPPAARSADILPDRTPRSPERGRPCYNGLSLSLAQEQATHCWQLPRRPEYGTLTRRTRSFYQDPGQWDPEGKPSVGSIAAAGFYYDGRSKIFNSYISHNLSTIPLIFKFQNFKYPTLI